MDAVPPNLMSEHQALVACSVKNTDQFYKQTMAERIAEEFFDDIFSLMMYDRIHG